MLSFARMSEALSKIPARYLGRQSILQAARMTHVCKNKVGSECSESIIENVVMSVDDRGRRLNYPKRIAVGVAAVNRDALITRPAFLEKMSSHPRHMTNGSDRCIPFLASLETLGD
jgi:hypothetical protein